MKKLLLIGLGILLLGAYQYFAVQPKTAFQLNREEPMKYSILGQTDADHLWLEEIQGKDALDKVNQWNKRSAKKMQGKTYASMKNALLEVYNSPEKIPYVSYRAGNVYNFWQDDKHVKGIWRMTTLDSYRTDNPGWETLLDIDKLAEIEGKSWVYKGVGCLAPDYNRCIVSLSEGGKDATVRREYDIAARAFVDDGFSTTESKGSTTWVDKNHLLIGVDFGSNTMTDSGYPMVSKLWRRGTPMSEARELMRGEKTDVAIWPGTFDNKQGHKEILLVRALTFYETEHYWIPQTGNKAFTPILLPLPLKASLGAEYKDQQLVSLQQPWRGYASGALISFSLSDFMQTGRIETLHEVIIPKKRQSIGNYSATKSAVLLSLYDNVSGSAYSLDFDGKKWQKQKLDFPATGNVSIGSSHYKEDIAFISTESFLTPDSLWMLDSRTLKAERIKSLPEWFDASSMTVEQFESTSSDGTRIPYYIVHAKNMKLDGKNPTLLYGYGGFEVSLNPSYSATIGRAWLERGGVYVLANIRGGGEFGPDWHQAGLKTKRQIIYDDFISIAEDLIQRKITRPKHLGIHGGSNGGLLVGVMFTQRPDLFNAVVCAVPLLDMTRYHTLLAGASWVGEYGDPDEPIEGKFLQSISPYHNIRDNVDYPEIYIYTSTMDDRVHPAHARKFAQRLEDLGHSFLYYENTEGGHSAAANLKEQAHSQALVYSYLVSKLMQPDE